MTNKELFRIYQGVDHFRRGYCCEYQAKTPKHELIFLGSNSGVYGWNWSAYLETSTNTLYVSNYRNLPAYMEEK